MVIVKLHGGLGNQMFQYATGRRLAHVLQTDLKLDITGFERDPLRIYHLSCFRIQEQFATPREIANFAGRKPWNVMFQRLHPRFAYTVIREKPFPRFVPEVLCARGNVYLKGYWQSEKYFYDIRAMLLQEFAWRQNLDAENMKVVQDIQQHNAIAIHSRRGDYVTNPQTQQFHGTCSLEYYHQAVEIITARVEHPHFFVFSDDPEWCQRNIQTDFPTIYMTHNPPERGHDDLRLMAQCKHFILANSSFSWWGAWLADYPEKMVIAPNDWFGNIDANRHTDHIVPKQWIQI
jgi:hypothetical protein